MSELEADSRDEPGALSSAKSQTTPISIEKTSSSKRNMRHSNSNSTSWLLLLLTCFFFLEAHHRGARDSSLPTAISVSAANSQPQTARSSVRAANQPTSQRQHWYHSHHIHWNRVPSQHQKHEQQQKQKQQQHQHQIHLEDDSARQLQQGSIQYWKQSENHQVPEQVPIVVSSSDNSYVSASPFVIDQISPLAMRTTTPSVVDYQEEQRGRPTRRRLPEVGKPIKRDRTRSLKVEEPRTKIREKSRGFSHFRNPFLWSWSSSGDRLIDNKLNSTGDISTTATTTQRNQHESVPNQEAKPRATRAQHLLSKFEIKLATIINTQDSIDAGATFINYTVVTNFDACLVECWITDSCDTAVYQESAVVSHSSSASILPPYSEQHLQQHNSIRHYMSSSKSRHESNDLDITDGLEVSMEESNYHVCFLFECVKLGQFRCQFSSHKHYVSSLLMEKMVGARPEVDRTTAQARTDGRLGAGDKIDVAQIGQDVGVRRIADDVGCDHDDKTKFKCTLQNSMVGCIESSQYCDGVADCLDESDESACSGASSDHPYRLFGSSSHDNQATTTTGSAAITEPAMAGESSNEFTLADGARLVKATNLRPVVQPVSEAHYSRIMQSHHQLEHHPVNGDKHRRQHWHDAHIASIRIGEYHDYGKGGLDGALIAILFGVAITAMLIMIVGHKMRSIRRRLAYKNRRRSLVPDKELFISTMSI